MGVPEKRLLLSLFNMLSEMIEVTLSFSANSFVEFPLFTARSIAKEALLDALKAEDFAFDKLNWDTDHQKTSTKLRDVIISNGFVWHHLVNVDLPNPGPFSGWQSPYGWDERIKVEGLLCQIAKANLSLELTRGDFSQRKYTHLNLLSVRLVTYEKFKVGFTLDIMTSWWIPFPSNSCQ